MDISYMESEQARFSGHKRMQKYKRCQNTGHYAYKYCDLNAVQRTKVRDNRPPAKKVSMRGYEAVAKYI